MSQTSVAQINVRLPRKLKESGDSGLQALGISPSDAVRLLWTRLSERGEGLAVVREFLLGEAEANKSPVQPFESSALAQGWSAVDVGLASLGLTLEHDDGPDEPEDDLVARALEERMRERGLI